MLCGTPESKHPPLSYASIVEGGERLLIVTCVTTKKSAVVENVKKLPSDSKTVGPSEV